MPKKKLSYEDIYETHAFQYLAQGMKDKHAINIVLTMMMSPLDGAWINFERWCRESIEEEESKADAKT